MEWWVWMVLGVVIGFCVGLLASRPVLRRAVSNAAVRVTVAEQQVEKAEQQVEKAKQKRKVIRRRLRNPGRAE